MESTVFEERYELWALEDQDEIALRRRSPTLLVWLAEHPLPLGVELYGAPGVYLERSRDDAGNLVALLDAPPRRPRRRGDGRAIGSEHCCEPGGLAGLAG